MGSHCCYSLTTHIPSTFWSSKTPPPRQPPARLALLYFALASGTLPGSTNQLRATSQRRALTDYSDPRTRKITSL